LGEKAERVMIGYGTEQAAGHDDRLAADLVGEPAEEQKADGGYGQCDDQRDVGGVGRHLERVHQEYAGVELAAVPDHGLAGREAEQSDDSDLSVLPIAESLGQRRL